MATATGKVRCFTCDKEKSAYKCGGCSQEFCFEHLADHKQELSKQFDEIEVNRDIFRQTLTEQTIDLQNHSLIQQIDKWERDSIKQIQQTADETRQLLVKHTTGYIKQIEARLNKLTNQLRQSREENDFNETDLRQFHEQLTRLTKELTESSNISIRQDSVPLITKISIDVRSGKRVSLIPTNESTSLCSPNIGANTRWVQNGITVVGGNGEGNGLNQLSYPYGIYVDDDQTVYIADYSNHRIVKKKCDATRNQVVAGGNGSENRTDQLNGPTHFILDKEKDCLIICDRSNRRIVRWSHRNGTRGETIISDADCYGLAMDNDGSLYVSDTNKHEVKRWRIGDTYGTVVAGGNGKGDRFDQLNYPTCIFVDQNHSLYVSDYNNHRVMKWMEGAKEGIIVAGRGEGNGLTQLSGPYGIVVDQQGTVYVADFRNDRVVRWPKGARQSNIVVGGNGIGEQSNQLAGPTGLTFDRQGNLYVADSNNHRVQKFNIDST